ncbi:MAG: hypothetical protein KC464_18135 [Myxococcales bacterium]|nr:hypothetical protein [Myxococcales bacterium]
MKRGLRLSAADLSCIRDIIREEIRAALRVGVGPNARPVDDDDLELAPGEKSGDELLAEFRAKAEKNAARPRRPKRG